MATTKRLSRGHDTYGKHYQRVQEARKEEYHRKNDAFLERIMQLRAERNEVHENTTSD